MLHEPQSSLLGSPLDILSGLREEIAEIEQYLLLNAHKDDVRLICLRSQGLEHEVALEIVQDLVITKVRIGRQVQHRLFLPQLIILVVEDLNLTGLNEIHLLDAALIANDRLPRKVDPAIQIDDELIDESALTLLKEVTEALLELLEL